MDPPKTEPKAEPRDWSVFDAPERLQGQQAKAVQEIDVQTNLFGIDVTSMKKVYKYRIEMFKATEDEEKIKELTFCPKNDYAVQARRRVTYSLFQDMLAFCARQGTPMVEDKYDILYDCGNIFYCINKIDNLKEIVLNLDAISSSNTKSHIGHKFVKVKINIMPIGEIDPQTAIGDSRELIQFIELLTSALVNKNGDHLIFKNRTYEKSSRSDADIREGKVVKPGNQKNCRLVQHHGKVQVMLQLDSKKSPFFSAVNIVEYCMRFLEVKQPSELRRLNIKKLNVQLKDLWVRTTHTPKEKTQFFPIAKLDSESAESKRVEIDGEEITVADYFMRKYKMKLNYPFLPLVLHKKGSKILSYPMEVLEIERGQRVTTNKSTPNMAEKMIRECQLRPNQLVESINNQMKNLMIMPESNNRYLQNFGVRVDGRAEVVPGRVLHPPAIQYKNKLVEPNRDGTMMWKLGPQDHFVVPIELREPWMFIIFDRCIQDNAAKDFTRALCKRANDLKMFIDERKVVIKSLPSERDDLIENCFQEAKQNRMRFIGCVTQQKLDPVHNVMKFLEAKYSIVTQHVSRQTFQKALGNQGNFMVLSNLVSKTNPKLGGLNHSVDMSKSYKIVNPQDAHAFERLFNKRRMFIGLDVSHAGPQSFADRALGVGTTEPTVVGMSYNVNFPTQMRGMFWLQEPRLATISRLAHYGINALNDFSAVTKAYPEDIIVFRNGASEGEYGKVAEEMKELSNCFAEISRVTGRPYNPSITAISVQTSSNYRMVPTKIDPRAKPFEQNVKPGTCVDSEVVNPNLDEFLLVPQKAIQGTARVIKCTVVFRRGRTLPMVDLENIANMLTYGHQTVAGSTGVPCHVYAAANLAKRGRNNWKVLNYGDCDARSEVSGGSGGKIKHDGSPDFFEKVTQQLASNLKTHFWA